MAQSYKTFLIDNQLNRVFALRGKKRLCTTPNIAPLFHILLPDDQCDVVIVEIQVAVIVDKVVDVARLGAVLVGEVTELKASFQEGVAVYLGLAPGIEFLQNTPVFAQDVIDVSNEISGIAVLLVVKGTSALIGTEAFVRATLDRLPADQASFPFFHT